MEDNDTIVFENSEISWSRPLRFWLLFISVIPSITCSLFVLYHLLFDQTLRHALNNHTIIVLLLLALVFQLIDVTWYLDFIRRGIVWPQTPARCLVWWLVDLVYTLPVCGATPCHILHPIIGLWEMGVHGCLCTMIIAFSSIALLIRVIIQKHRHNQIFQWKKYRKNDISTVARQCGLPADVGVEELLVAFFITYWVMLLLLIVSLMFLPGLKTKITKLSSVHSSILTNLCSNFTTCNCTLTNNTNLEIVCNPTLSLSVLPTLINNTLQSSVTYLHVSSSINGTPGPLITLPINICSSYPSISVLDLSSNSITGFLNTSELACLSSNLIRVNFSNNFINNIDLNFFKSNRKLQTIDLSYNNLTTMPTIDAGYYINFTSTLTLMNFSYNQITNVDLWPLFVKTRNSMTIDMSYNLITNWTNNVPVYVKQLTETPDPRILYLNNNQIEHLSDLLLEQYGACSTLSFTTTAYFVVGISNILLTNNPLICDCESYNLITFIDDRIYDFPLINNGSALLTQATCTATDEQLYNLLSFNQWSSCVNYTLTQISNAFCSIYTNASNSTISPPTYWPTTTTIFTTVFTTVFTTIINGNGTVTVSGGGNTGSSNDENSSKNSSSPSWYIILGIVLGLVLIIFLILLGIFLCKDKLLPEKCRSKLRNNDNNPNNSYEPIIRNSELSSQGTYPLNGIKAGRASMSTSTCGVDDQDNGILQFDDDGIHSDRTSTNGHHYWTDKIYPEQETQTCFQIIRPKPSTVQSRSRRDPQQIKNPNDDILENSRRKRKTSSSTATNATTNTTNVIKGIPISSVSIKIPSIISNGNDTIPDTSISELSVTSIPLTPSKRAKLLPQLKNGIYFDSTNNNLLNTSASALITNQRQRRLSSMWTHNQHQNVLTPLPTRPQSMITCKTDFNQEDSSDEEESSIPTVESLTRKSSKPLRALPLLNITVIPAWIGDNDDQK